MTSEANVLEHLLGLGFHPITESVLRREKIALASLKWQDHGGWLYAFVVLGEVKYIGLTDRVMRSRMDEYRDVKNSQTSRLRDLVIAELLLGRTVLVYGNKERNKDVCC